jgi:hypothetical protein
MGALVCVHVWANAEFAPHQTAATSSRILTDFIFQLMVNEPPAKVLGKWILRIKIYGLGFSSLV